MVRPFDTSLQEIHTLLLQMARMVEVAIHHAVKSFVHQDAGLAQKVIEDDPKVNELEGQIDDKVVKLIATQQPVARDLRTLIAAMKLSNDLERMADLAQDIAEVALELQGKNLQALEPLDDIIKMAEITQQMVHNGINSYIDSNTQLANSLATVDDEVDRLNEKVVREMIAHMHQYPEHMEVALRICLVARYLQRIADHTVNLGESVIFIETGKQRDLK